MLTVSFWKCHYLYPNGAKKYKEHFLVNLEVILEDPIGTGMRSR